LLKLEDSLMIPGLELSFCIVNTPLQDRKHSLFKSESQRPFNNKLLSDRNI